MKKLLIIASLLATTACTTVSDSTVQRAYKIALAAEKAAASIRCPKEGTERRVFLAGRKLFDVAFGNRISPDERAELNATRISADNKCGFTLAEAEAASDSLR